MTLSTLQAQLLLQWRLLLLRSVKLNLHGSAQYQMADRIHLETQLVDKNKKLQLAEPSLCCTVWSKHVCLPGAYLQCVTSI